ncbi:MAG TPA: SRPBCC family protein [Candidatus Limnocylindrales bacterium]|nr:SRPBCC family protein [Candidatus Limnocylindrales bacterium]
MAQVMEADVRNEDFSENRASHTSHQPSSKDINVGGLDRLLSIVGGGALAIYGLSQVARGRRSGVPFGLLGGALLQRGATGHCMIYQKLRITTADLGPRPYNVAVPDRLGIKVERSIVIERSPEELYRFWRNFENLPRFMDHLESVHVDPDGVSHWTATGPAGTSFHWQAEVYNEKENEMIAWRSLPGSDVDHAGSVHFEPSAQVGATCVRVYLKYDPPAGLVGAAVARLFGEEPGQQIEEDLQTLKRVMESADWATPADTRQPGKERGGWGSVFKLGKH